MILHIADRDSSSWSMRGWLLLKLSGLDFQEKIHHFQDDKEAQRSAKHGANFRPLPKCLC